MSKQVLSSLFLGSYAPHLGIALISLKPINQSARFAETGLAGPHADGKKRIMLVDDEKDIALSFRSGLERNGFSVEVFTDPVDALSHFRPEYYDLLLLDIRMPKMSGFELCREIRKLDKKTKVCFISAFEVHQDEMRKYLIDQDEKCVVKKPVSMKDLVRAINEEISEAHGS